MANTFNPAGFGACLLAANERTGSKYGSWRPSGPDQNRALNLRPREAELAKLPELESWASDSHDKLNRILAERRFDSRFEKFKEDRFGVLSILDLTVRWLGSGGRKQKVRAANSDRQRDGFRLSGRDCGVAVNIERGSPRIAKIRTKSDDVVWVFKTPYEKVRDDLEAAEIARSLVTDARYRDFTGGNFTGPCISFRESRPLEWIEGLEVPGAVQIESGFQETIFGMNELGARAKVATGMAATITCCVDHRVEFYLDGPCILAIERPGIESPIFSAFVTTKDWKDPGGFVAGNDEVEEEFPPEQKGAKTR